MSDSIKNDNDDYRFEKKVKKNIKKTSRRETKMHLEDFKYDLDSDRMYDIMDDMED